MPFDAPHSLAMTAEMRLLIAAARDPSARAAEECRRLCALEIDWDRLLSLAARHRVHPHIWRALRNCPHVPAPVRQHLEGRCHDVARRNLLLTGKLLRILDRLESHGIRAVAYKGPALAQHVYGEISQREFDDLDILLLLRDAMRAVNILRHEGLEADEQIPAAATERYLRLEREFHLSSDDGAAVELHWAVCPRYFALDLPVESLLDRSQCGELLGRPVRRLSWPDLLQVLCVHGALHCWSRLEWVCAVDRLVRLEHDLDWPATLAGGQRSGAGRMLLLGLALANRLLDTPLPARVASAIAGERQLARLLATAVRWMDCPREPRRGLAHCAFHIRCRERIRDGIQYVLRLGLMPNAAQLATPSAAGPLRALHPPLRLARLACKWMGQVTHIALR